MTETCVCGHDKGRHLTTNVNQVTQCYDCGCGRFFPAHIPSCTCIIVNGERRSTERGGCPVHGTPRATVDPDDPMLTVEAQKRVIAELMGKIQMLVDWADEKGLLEDGAFTFPDGDTWKARDES